jgi:hypothetical protein
LPRILGRASALALIAGLCATIPTADATSRAHTAPALTLPAHPDGLSRALASGRISPAREALLRAEALFHPARVAAGYGPVAPPAGRDGTMILRDLALRLGSLSPADRKVAHGILARPATDAATVPGAWQDGEVPHSPECGANVCLHWAAPGDDAPAATDADLNTYPDWVDAALATSEHVWDAEVTTMGYRAPRSDLSSPDHGPDGKLDIYISNLGNDDLYGYCTSDDPALNTPGTFTASAYCVVDNNYS